MTRKITIDQDLDRPKVKFLTTRLGEDMRLDNRTWITTDSITGTVEDDDGIVQSIKVKKNNGEWITLKEGDNSFNFTTDENTPANGLEDGDWNILFQIIDNKGGIFNSENTVSNTSIIIEDADKVCYGLRADKDNAVKKNTILYTTIDTKQPQIGTEKFYNPGTSAWEDIGSQVSATFGGTDTYGYRYLKIQFSATDKNGIATSDDSKPSIVLGSQEVTDLTKDGNVYSGQIDLEDISSGNHTFSIKIRDKAMDQSMTKNWVEKSYVVKVDGFEYLSSVANKTSGCVTERNTQDCTYIGRCVVAHQDTSDRPVYYIHTCNVTTSYGYVKSLVMAGSV